ncbi:MAG: nucleoside-diphosphate sugar epimerase/dehydratase [Candidatus Electryonea clarkiae]|nr:nucleoside-diphosphate sugar epimerase/dehydratase [Candidatus Electryonea clarkiae]MDP8288872.1 nucleoside-diphosphate sugar epimerase/dehydratase [Candidatus Electryonea clarkiae]
MAIFTAGRPNWRLFAKISIDIAIFAVALITGYFLRFSSDIAMIELKMLGWMIPVFLLVRIISFYTLKLHSMMWRYGSIIDLINLIKATTIGTAAMVLITYFASSIHIPRLIFVMEWLLVVVLSGGIRLLVRQYFEMKSRQNLKAAKVRRVLIYGAGRAGELLMRDIINAAHTGIEVIGFLDDDPLKSGQYIHNKRVLGDGTKILDIVQKRAITHIYFAISSLSGMEVRRILKLIGDQAGETVSIQIIPGLKDLVDGRVNVNQLRGIEIKDLLRRKPVDLDREPLEKLIHGRVSVVVGGGGSIGSELCRQIALLNPELLVVIDSSEYNLYSVEMSLKSNFPNLSITGLVGDATNRKMMRRLFEKYRPELVFHAAAYKHVPLMEANPTAAVFNNLTSTLLLTDLSVEFGVKCFIMVSSDKAVQPTNVMGATKWACEQIVIGKSNSGTTAFIAVRFGNVLGSSGSVIPLFQKQIESGGPITVTHEEITRYFMLTSEAVELVLQAGAVGKSGHIYVLDMGDPIRIMDLAKYMIELSGLKLDEDIRIAITGLRPGEKLHEDLYLEGEEKVTNIPGVFILSRNQVPADNYIQQVQKFIDNCYDLSDDEVRQQLKSLVPGYNPQLNETIA